MDGASIPTFTVVVIPMFGDNYCYYVHATNNPSKGFYVDLAEYSSFAQFQMDYGLGAEPVTHVMTTHHHWDHSGGNKQVKAKYPNCEVFGGKADNVPGGTKGLKDGDKISLFGGDLTVNCLHTPCHTRGHILYHCEAKGAQNIQQNVQKDKEMMGPYMLVKNVTKFVFTGDTVFIGGCGLFMEGTAPQMLKAFDVAQKLPMDTYLFVGHEYTLKNLTFAHKVEGNKNPNIAAAFQMYEDELKKGFYTVPSVLAHEKEYNVFMRCRLGQMQNILGVSKPEQCMKFLRDWKNSGNRGDPRRYQGSL